MSKLLTVWMLVSISIGLQAQQEPPQITTDTLRAKEFMLVGDSLRGQAYFKEAYTYFEKAYQIYDQWKIWDGYMKSKGLMGSMLWRLSRFTESEKLLNEVITQSPGVLDSVNVPRAEALYTMGALLGANKGQYAKGIAYINQALSLFEALYPKVHSQVGKCYNLLAIIYAQSGDFDNGVKYLNVDLNITRQLYGEEHYNFVQGLEVMASLHWYRTDYDSAFYYSKQVLEGYTKLYGTNSSQLISAYGNLGLLSRTQGKNDLALEYLFKSRRLMEKTYDRYSQHFLNYHMNVGGVYFEKREFDSALVHYDRSLEIATRIYDAEHHQVATLINNKALVFEDQQRHDLAVYLYERALSIRRNIPGLDNLETAQIYINLGRNFYKAGDFEKARENLEQALSIHNRLGQRDFAGSPRDNHYPVEAYLLLSKVLLKEKDLEQALKHVQTSLVRNVYGFNNDDVLSNPETFDACYEDFYLNGLELKAEILIEKYNKTDDPQWLQYSLKTFRHAYDLIDHFRMYRSNLSDKISLGRDVQSASEQAIETCIKLYEITGEEQFLKEAFEFSERNRAFLIRHNLLETQAKEFVGIPKELTQFEQELRFRKSRLQSSLLDAKKSGLRRTLQDQLFDLNRTYDSLIQVFEKGYPEYFHLKHDLEIPRVSELQDQMGKDELLLEFFSGEEGVTVFGLTRDTLVYHNTNNYSAIVEAIQGLQVVLSPEGWYAEGGQEQFVQNSSFLFSELLFPVFEMIDMSSINRLTIIPDGELSYIPFQLLLTAPVRVYQGYKEMPFLLKKYAVRNQYAIDPELLFQSKGRHKKRGILGVAPSYTSPDSLDKVRLGKFRGQIEPLQHNTREVDEIIKTFGGQSLLREEALESTFKTLVKDFPIVHMSMHALIDDEQPMNSKMAFAKEPDASEDGYLHAFELYNMRLAPELMVLSACNTGVGRVQKGEGMMSLSHAFAYAGVPSLVVSYWPVDDQTTSELMQLFYKELYRGKDKAEALRSAQLKFLDESTAVNTNPFYWGGFTIIGDPSPITVASDNRLFYILLLLIGLPLLLFLIRRRMRINNRISNE